MKLRLTVGTVPDTHVDLFLKEVPIQIQGLFPGARDGARTKIFPEPRAENEKIVGSGNQCCGSGSVRIRIICPYPDPYRSLRIRIRELAENTSAVVLQTEQ